MYVIMICYIKYFKANIKYVNHISSQKLSVETVRILYKQENFATQNHMNSFTSLLLAINFK